MKKSIENSNQKVEYKTFTTLQEKRVNLNYQDILDILSHVFSHVVILHYICHHGCILFLRKGGSTE